MDVAHPSPYPLGAYDARPPVPLSDGLDTRPCKILDPSLVISLAVAPVGHRVLTLSIVAAPLPLKSAENFLKQALLRLPYKTKTSACTSKVWYEVNKKYPCAAIFHQHVHDSPHRHHSRHAFAYLFHP